MKIAQRKHQTHFKRYKINNNKKIHYLIKSRGQNK